MLNIGIKTDLPAITHNTNYGFSYISQKDVDCRKYEMCPESKGTSCVGR